jgi:peptidoglycan/xylan/chitin deacetylase (PgdA/CDA1 family)
MANTKASPKRQGDQSESRAESEALRLQQRFDYSAIVDRPKLKLPKGVRLIVWPVVNIEEWSIDRPMPRGVSNAPGGQASLPDTQNWGWHEYGMRVGFWRLAESLAKHRIRPTLSINAKVCETRPRVAQAALDAGWEFMAHCYEQMPIQAVADQPAMMRQTIEVLQKFTGRRPTGWLGPGRGQTWATPDHMAANGFTWFGDWVMDDQPFWVKTATKPLLSIPYSVELNDITIMLTGLHESDAMLRRAKDAFDQVYRESAKQPRVLSFGVHPYISGAAHRAKYFDAMLRYFRSHKDVVFWQGEQIFDWFSGQVKP